MSTKEFFEKRGEFGKNSKIRNIIKKNLFKTRTNIINFLIMQIKISNQM